MPVRTPKARRILAHTPPEIFVGRGEQAREITSLAAPSADEWVEQLIQTFERAVGVADERTLARLCLEAPRLAAARGVRSVVMLDDVHLAERLRGEVALGPEVAHAAALGPTPFVLAGLRRRAADILNGAGYQVGPDSLRRLHLDRLKEADARELVEGLARTQSVAVNDETRDLLVQQLESSPYL